MPFTRREAIVSAGALATVGLFSSANTTAQDSNPGSQTSSATNSEPICLADFEPLAKAKMSAMSWEFVTAGAADELTVQWNKESYRRIRLKPRVLVGVSKLDTRVSLLGQEHAFPILLAPTSAQT